MKFPLRVRLKRPSGKRDTAKLVDYIPAGVELDMALALRYSSCNALALELQKPARYGRHVFLIDGTVNSYYICPDSEVGRTWWSEIHENKAS